MSIKNVLASYDSELVKRFKATGAIVLGKTNTPEFGITPYTEPKIWGLTRNPWNLNRKPGGSSGGSAAAIATGMVPLAAASDGVGDRVHEDCITGLQETIQLLQELGHEVIEDRPQFDGTRFALNFLTIIVSEIRVDLERTAKLVQHKVNPPQLS